MSCLKAKRDKEHTNLKIRNTDLKLVLVLGFCGVGKTSFVNRLVRGDFFEPLPSSKDIEWSKQFDYIVDDRNISIQFITPLLEVNSHLTDYSWYEYVNLVIIMYDITDYTSLKDVENTYWFGELQRNKTLPIITVGSRNDDSPREVSRKNIKKWCQIHNTSQAEISSKSGKGLDSLCDKMNILMQRSKKGYTIRTYSKSLSESSLHKL